MKQLAELKNSVAKIAAEQGKTEVEVITELQAAAAKVGNEELLNDLCDIKYDAWLKLAK